MLKKLSQIIFVFLSSSLVIFFILLGLNNSTNLDYKILYLFFLVIFPFLGPVLISIKDEENYFSKFSKLSFLFALFGLIATASLLIIGNNKIAENFSIYSYYFLLIGVVIEILGNIFNKKINNKIENTKEKKSNNFITIFIDDEINKKILNITSLVKKIIKDLTKVLTKKYFELINNEKNKNFILVIKIIGIILIYKIVEKNWEYFTISNLVYSIIGLIILFLSKDFITSNIFSNRNNNLNEKSKSLINQDIKKINIFSRILIFYKKNIKKINYFLYSLNSILVILALKYELIFILEKTIIIFIISYIYSLFLNKKYLNNLNFKEIINKNYFLNKAVIFSSVGTVTGYLILNIFKIKNTFILENQVIVFLVIFLLFFTIFYLIFHNTNKRELLQNKTSLLGKIFIEKNINAGKKVKNFSPTIFIKNNIYTTLNIFLVIAILVTFGIKNNFFKDFYNDHINGIKAINFIVIEEKKVIKTFTTEEKISQIKKSLTSGEAKIIEKNINIENNNLKLDNKNESKYNNSNRTIKVRNFYKFKKSLSKSKNKNPEVKKLEEIMKKLGYFSDEPDLIFDEKTRLSLVKLLKTECDWPETTKGILGFKAQLCLYGLDIEK